MVFPLSPCLFSHYHCFSRPHSPPYIACVFGAPFASVPPARLTVSADIHSFTLQYIFSFHSVLSSIMSRFFTQSTVAPQISHFICYEGDSLPHAQHVPSSPQKRVILPPCPMRSYDTRLNSSCCTMHLLSTLYMQYSAGMIHWHLLVCRFCLCS